MKKRQNQFLLSLITILIISILAACGNGASDNGSKETKEDSEPKTRIYQAESGDIELPANPEKVVVLGHTYAGNLLKLGITPIAVNEWPKNNKFYEGKLDDVELVTSDSLEKILELEPDLIITYSTEKNIDKLSKIAPTVALTYEKYNYLDQHIEIGKIVGKEKEAKEWVDQWNEKTKEEGEKVKAAIGEDATFMVLEGYGKDLYVYGNNWGRGTEVLYQALGLKPSEKIKQEVFGTGWKAISSEVIPEYAGDYIFLGDGEGADNSFMETDVWKGIPAVQKNQVFTFDSQSFYFNDPITLENQLEFIVNALTK